MYGEDVYVGYRYYDGLEVDPLFPFGYGLSYTTFKVSGLQMARNAENTLRVQCKVQNTGSRDGAEVVQVYIAPMSSPIRRPVKELKEFKKLRLQAGSDEVVDISLDIVRATSFWDEKSSSWCSHSGSYRIMVGTSSRGEFLEEVLEVAETTFWSGSWDAPI